MDILLSPLTILKRWKVTIILAVIFSTVAERA
jgi:hypothetical protein